MDTELIQKISENEREIALLRDDLKRIKEQRDLMQEELTSCRSDLKEAMDKANFLEKRCHKAETELFDTILENENLKSELEEKNSAMIVSGAAKKDLEEKLKMSLFQNSQLKTEIESLKEQLVRATVRQKNQTPQPTVSPEMAEDNPYVYHSPYVKQALYDERFFGNGIKIDDYDFGYLKVGKSAALAGRIVYNNDGKSTFVPNQIDLLSMCSRMPHIGGFKYVYGGFDKEKKTAIISFSGINPTSTNDAGYTHVEGICDVPLTHCFNIDEIDRWYDDWYNPEPVQDVKKKRGLFKGR